ncbi:hypothetical protein CSB93_3146 [Pseudomonas paraeruginosa]|uniref:Uncharacterized protein n=1 Tax=Pseudomonas paraeruginosa TaxID=2994495 RepID=A0A2R3IUF2_9PSED|nr:hypothetical protein CSB93_3146 [Pseudomonas paraeruginosa]AWE90464.1 hypothetical protein CSC28_1921 [Pseudomonas paraeruginosa]PTC37610.1 hypothetical protein CLJ1_1765 [Pseudomonas aeruginosa]
MDVITNLTVMIQARVSVNQRITANFDIWLNYGSRHQL